MPTSRRIEGMANSKHPIGEVVRLKSGGPLMTVNQEHDYGHVICVWFVGDERREGKFNEDALTKAS